MRGAALATRSALTDYVRANYKISEETPHSLKLIFDVGNHRSQVSFNE